MKKQADNGHRWTDEELKVFIGMWLREVDTAVIAKNFGTSEYGINKLAQRLRREGIGLPRKRAGHKASRSNKPWTQEEVEYLVRRRNDRVTAEQIGIELNRTFCSVQAMIQELRKNDVQVKMLGNGVRRLWNFDSLKMAIAGRGLGGIAE